MKQKPPIFIWPRFVEFLDKAREAKAAAAVVVPPDSGVQDSSGTDSTTVLPVERMRQLQVALHGNMLVAGTGGECRFAVASVTGSLAWFGSFRGTLDLSSLSSGVYAIVVTAPSGAKKSLKFFKK